ncbi:MAG: hypothetical protein P8J55_09690 [Pseudomonadales bacterium]|nr:hypothetical protein [Pseudomonadales bacterium]
MDRAKLYIQERFQHDEAVDVEMIQNNIERTRFPVPTEEDAQESTGFPGLIRSADLIGQLAAPQYMRKISALFAEFRETGQAEKMGYIAAADLRQAYPGFFWNVATPFITEGIRFLRRTQEGQMGRLIFTLTSSQKNMRRQHMAQRDVNTRTAVRSWRPYLKLKKSVSRTNVKKGAAASIKVRTQKRSLGRLVPPA